MQSIEQKLPDLTERERRVLNKHTKSIINQLLKDPILQVKELAGSRLKRLKRLHLFQQIFDLEEAVSVQAEQKETIGKNANKNNNGI